ncbi:hypothetical protein TNCV_685471 [Trichonephila clavipes]|nr:hypothetical protein TNCV_685471 [Trichonephila clavipes]
MKNDSNFIQLRKESRKLFKSHFNFSEARDNLFALLLQKLPPGSNKMPVLLETSSMKETVLLGTSSRLRSGLNGMWWF